MTYRLIIPPDIRRQIQQLTLEDQHTLDQLLRDIQADPESHTGAYGENTDGPIQMRSAGRGNILAVIIVNQLTINITLVQVQAPLG
ncbi:hypothetical protein [Streptomyces smyrnaeus]|uniref:hypothetical protein n=1 Tax=Streptomyces smyrnaeus TaxID=1387713 RepID=UPI0033C40763